MTVREIMRTRGPSIRPTDGWPVAVRALLSSGARVLPVVEDGALLGLVGERAVLAAQASGGFSAPVGRSWATPEIGPGDEVDRLVGRMASEGVEGYAVVDEVRWLGVVTAAELLPRLARQPLPRRPERVRDRMAADPPCATLDEPLAVALERMRERAVRHLPVIDGGRQVIGMLSDSDLRAAVGDLIAAEDADRLRARLRLQEVSDVARRSALVIPQGASLSDAAQMLVGHGLEALAVVDEDWRLVGLLTSLDLLGAGHEGLRPRFSPSEPRPVLH